jgi:hypothetical protein
MADNLPEVFTTSMIRDSQDQNISHRKKHSSRQSLYNLLNTFQQLLFIRRVQIIDLMETEIKGPNFGFIKTTYCSKIAYFLKYYLEIQNIWDLFATNEEATSIFNSHVEVRIKKLRDGLKDKKSWIFGQISSILETEPAFLDMSETVIRISAEYFLKRKNQTASGFSRAAEIGQIMGKFEEFLRAIRSGYSRSVYIPVYVEDGFWRFIPLERLNDPDFLKTPLMELVPHDIQKTYSPADTNWFLGYGITSLVPSDEREIPDLIGFYTPKSVGEMYWDSGIERFRVIWPERSTKMISLDPKEMLRPLVSEKRGLIDSELVTHSEIAKEFLKLLKNRLLSMKPRFRQTYSDLLRQIDRKVPQAYSLTEAEMPVVGLESFEPSADPRTQRMKHRPYSSEDPPGDMFG